jgi:hypothetical protein
LLDVVFVVLVLAVLVVLPDGLVLAFVVAAFWADTLAASERGAAFCVVVLRLRWVVAGLSSVADEAWSVFWREGALLTGVGGTRLRVMLAVMSLAVFMASRVRVDAICLPASKTV